MVSVCAAVIIKLSNSALDSRIYKEKLHLKITDVQNEQESGQTGLSGVLRNDNGSEVYVTRRYDLGDLHIQMFLPDGTPVPRTSLGNSIGETGLTGFETCHAVMGGDSEYWFVSLPRLREKFALKSGTYSIKASVEVQSKDGFTSVPSNVEQFLVPK